MTPFNNENNELVSSFQWRRNNPRNATEHRNHPRGERLSSVIASTMIGGGSRKRNVITRTGVLRSITRTITNNRNASSSMSTPKMSSRKKSRGIAVRFNGVVKVCETISRLDYTKEEKLNCWYSKKENEDIRKAKHFIEHMMGQMNHFAYGQALLDDDTKYCTRGCNSQEDAGRRKQYRHQSCTVVLYHQEQQQRQQQNDENHISQQAKENTKHHLRMMLSAFKNKSSIKHQQVAAAPPSSLRIMDVEAIASAYSKFAYSSAMEARRRAVLDEDDASMYQDETSATRLTIARNRDDHFSDEWITSLSSSSDDDDYRDESPSSSSSSDIDLLDADVDDFDDSGFDDAWIRDIASKTGILI